MERSFSIVLIKTTLIDRAIKVASRRCGERVIEHRSGVISNNSTDNSTNNQSANELVIATAVVMMIIVSRRWRRRLAVALVLAMVMAHGLRSWGMLNAMRRPSVSVVTVYTVGRSFAMARATVMVAAQLELHGSRQVRSSCGRGGANQGSREKHSCKSNGKYPFRVLQHYNPFFLLYMLFLVKRMKMEVYFIG